MKQRLAALTIAASIFAAAPLALADVPGPSSSSSSSGSTTTTSGAGGDDGGDETSSGCTASQGTAGGSAAIVLGLGLLFAIPLARRRSPKK